MADDPFDRDPAVLHGVAEDVAPGVRRVVAPNPSPMTFTGTASYLVGRERIAVIDPGPDDPRHIAALRVAAGVGRVVAILVTHTHLDHSAGAAALSAATGAPSYAFGPHGAGIAPRMQALSAADAAAGGALGGGEGADRGFAPTHWLGDGGTVESDEWRLGALHTPGHLSNHLCFALEGAGVLFTGDHVMGWATSMVSPPDGDMAAFMASLEKLARRDDRLYLPGHGRPVRDPAAMVAWQMAHRRAREGQILDALAQGSADPHALTRALYADVDPRLWPAAARSVLAHLLALEAGGRVQAEGPPGPAARFRLTG
ncbi:MAG: MBL fold metallo-hydrolase [Rhodobacterales bacterium CG18_big_fil_WC_8_21_14_2_50_71_9]|nr:MAG: MBL fold metallo-hydrolase [Rhodobacterales bacterium CG18_big_fil_WC_8_21_14_2_50_71_9]PJA60623.1 MAG: MBL fold metallo-hydrolase [Rhodobacterales bacterium CG_4_9_14_3_um_filter_71_31]